MSICQSQYIMERFIDDICKRHEEDMNISSGRDTKLLLQTSSVRCHCQEGKRGKKKMQNEGPEYLHKCYLSSQPTHVQMGANIIPLDL